MKHFIAIAFVLAAISPFAPAQAGLRPVVVELFTSQGCSSCPPADVYLRELAQRDDVIALAWHVDYWDRLGWPDPFALARATERQGRYRALLGVRSLYTPQMVIDGSAQAVGSDRAAVAGHLAARRADIDVKLRIQGDFLQIQAAAVPGAVRGVLVQVFGLRSSAETSVRRGENSGRSLLEANIVRDVFTLGELPAGGSDFLVKRVDFSPDVDRVVAVVQSADMHIWAAAQADWR